MFWGSKILIQWTIHFFIRNLKILIFKKIVLYLQKI